MSRSWSKRGCFGKYLIQENLFAVFFSFNSGIILLLNSPAIYIPHGRSCLMADKLRCMNQVKLLDINVCHQKKNKTKRSMERDVEKEKSRKKKSQRQREHLHIWKEKKVKCWAFKFELLITVHPFSCSLQSSD